MTGITPPGDARRRSFPSVTVLLILLSMSREWTAQNEFLLRQPDSSSVGEGKCARNCQRYYVRARGGFVASGPHRCWFSASFVQVADPDFRIDRGLRRLLHLVIGGPGLNLPMAPFGWHDHPLCAVIGRRRRQTSAANVPAFSSATRAMPFGMRFRSHTRWRTEERRSMPTVLNVIYTGEPGFPSVRHQCIGIS